MPVDQVDDQADDEEEHWSLRGEKAALMAGYTLRMSQEWHPGNMPGPTSVTQTLDQHQVDSLRGITRTSIMNLQEEFHRVPPAVQFSPETDSTDAFFTIEGQRVQRGDTLSLSFEEALRAASGLEQHFGKDRVAGVPGPALPALKNDQMFRPGVLAGDLLFHPQALGEEEFFSPQELKSQERFKAGQLKSEIEFGAYDEKEDDLKIPGLPKRNATLVDSLSMISLLAQPRPLRMQDVDSVFARVGRKDGFAAAAFGNAPPSLLLPATADEIKRILNHEIGVDLTFQGYDFARPADMFQSEGKRPALDPAREKLVRQTVAWATAIATTHGLDEDGRLDLHAPGGFDWISKSYRTPLSGVAEQAGRVRAAVGDVVSPYMLDFKDPLLEILFPGATPAQKGEHPFQEWGRDATNFLLGWMLPGSNVRDVTGNHWLPVDGIRTSTYRSIDNFRKEIGAPQMVNFLMDDGMIRAASIDPHPINMGYTRGMFGMNPFGKELDRWPSIRGQQAAGVISNPVLGPKSTLTSMQLWGGTLMDPYTGKTETIEPLFVYRGVKTNEKTGKVTLNAPHVSLQQLDHVVPLSYAWQHGAEQMFEMAYQLFDEVGPLPSKKGDFRRLMLQNELVIGSGGLATIDFASLSPNSQKALRMMEAISRIGYASNPSQYALVAAVLNQAKGDKGPSQWIPFAWARNQFEHNLNKAYVDRWRAVIPDGRRAMEGVLGRALPDYLAVSRPDELAMRRIELGLDRANRFERPFTEAYVRYIDSPDLTESSLYRSIRGTMVVGEYQFATKLALWSLIPWSQAYLVGRDYLARGVWAHLFPRHDDPWKSTQLWTAEGRATAWARSKSLGNWFRGRMAGVPIGMSEPALTGDAAIFTLHDLVRSGRTEELVHGATGEVLSRMIGKTYLAHPDQVLRYVRGDRAAFGEDRARGLKPYETGRIQGMADEVRSRYLAYLETGDESFLPKGGQDFQGLTAPQRAHWTGELSILERAQDRLLAVGPQRPSDLAFLESRYVNRDLLRAVRRGVVEEYLVLSESHVGREPLEAIPFYQEFVEAVRHGKASEAVWLLSRQLAIKGADYSARAALGTGRGLANLLPQNFLPIVTMEGLALDLGKLTGTTVAKSLQIGVKDFKTAGFKDVFDWIKSVRNNQSKEARSLIASIRDMRAGLESTTQDAIKFAELYRPILNQAAVYPRGFSRVTYGLHSRSFQFSLAPAVEDAQAYDAWAEGNRQWLAGIHEKAQLESTLGERALYARVKASLIKSGVTPVDAANRARYAFRQDHISEDLQHLLMENGEYYFDPSLRRLVPRYVASDPLRFGGAFGEASYAPTREWALVRRYHSTTEFHGVRLIAGEIPRTGAWEVDRRTGKWVKATPERGFNETFYVANFDEVHVPTEGASLPPGGIWRPHAGTFGRSEDLRASIYAQIRNDPTATPGLYEGPIQYGGREKIRTFNSLTPEVQDLQKRLDPAQIPSYELRERIFQPLPDDVLDSYFKKMNEPRAIGDYFEAQIREAEARLRRVCQLRNQWAELMSDSPLRFHDVQTGSAVSRWAFQHPLATSRIFSAAALPGKAMEVVRAPFVFHDAVAARVAAGRFLRPVGAILGGGLQALGFVESWARFRHASSLAGRPYDSLTMDQRAELEAYTEPTTKDLVIHTFLDMGAPITPKSLFSKWGAAGAAMAGGNLIGQTLALGRAMQDTGFANRRLQRLVGDSATVQEQARYASQIQARRAVGLLQSETSLRSMFNVVDTGSYFSAMRDSIASNGDVVAKQKMAKKIEAQRQAWRMIPVRDSLGYETTKTRFGKTIEHPFQQAPEFVSDVSLVVTGRAGAAKFDTLNAVPAAARLVVRDRDDRLRRAAEKIRHDESIARIERVAKEGSLWKSMLLEVQMAKEDWRRPKGRAQDSADVARDLQVRRQLWAR